LGSKLPSLILTLNAKSIGETMSKKFTMKQLSEFTGLEPAKLAKLFLMLKKQGGKKSVLTKEAQQNLGILPMDVRQEALRRRPQDLPSERSVREKPRSEISRMNEFVIRGVPPVIDKIRGLEMSPPNAKEVINLLNSSMSPTAMQTPGMPGTYVAQAVYLMKQNLKAWRVALDAPNSAEWKRVVWLAQNLPGVKGA
jgi:hypothetical protein